MTEEHTIEIGQRWHLRLPGSAALSTMFICDVTELTVSLHKCCEKHLDAPRYKISDIEFVEEC